MLLTGRQHHEPGRRCGEAPPRLLIEGISLFNQGQYFECHEVLETLWRAEPDPVRYLYQGILHLGVAFHHLGRRNWIGAVRQLRRGIERLERYPPICQGVDVRSVVDQAKACLDMLEALGPERASDFDWGTVPRIQLVPVDRASSPVPGEGAQVETSRDESWSVCEEAEGE